MRRIPLTAAGAALALAVPLLAACGGTASGASARPGTVPVVASTDVYGDIARRIGGANASVTSIISNPDQDPHAYQANTKTQLDLSRAKVVIENGGGYDDFVDTMLGTANPTATVLNAVRISGETAPAGGDLNEHVWYDFPAMNRLAGRIAAALSSADPAHATTYRANARTFGGDLSALEKRTAALKKKYAGEGVAVTEPVPGYLLDAAGLRDRTPAPFSHAVEEGDDVPPRALRQTLGLFTGAGKVRALVYNAQTMSAQTEQVVKAARAGRVPAVPVTETLPDGTSYVSWMRGNVGALATALGRR